MTDKKKTNLFGKLLGKFNKGRKADESQEEPFDEFDDELNDSSDITAPGIRLEDIEEDEDDIFVAQEFNLSNEQKRKLEDTPEIPTDETELDEFPIEELPPLHVNESEDQIPDLPPSTLDEHSEAKKSNVTDNRPIDLDAIKNYEFTDEDAVEEEEVSIENFKMFDPAHGTKGIRAFFAKSKEKLGNIKMDHLKNKFKNFSNPKNIKSFKTPKIFQKFNWNKVIDALYNPNSRRTIHRAFIASTLVAGTYSTGKMVALALKGPPDTTATKAAPIATGVSSGFAFSDLNKVKQSNLFDAKMSDKDTVVQQPKREVVDADLICSKADKQSSLPFKLVNTTVLQDSVKSIASVQVRSSNELEDVRIGDQVNGVAEIGYIDRMKIIFKNLKTGECEYIASTDPKFKDTRQQFNIVSPEEGKKLIEQTKNEGIKNEGNSFRIKKSVRDKMLTNISEVLTQARAVQIKNPDGSYSFKMAEIVPGSIYSQLGIQDGDIITRINGNKITNLNEVMSLFGKIKEVDQFQLNIKRDGVDSVKDYEFE